MTSVMTKSAQQWRDLETGAGRSVVSRQQLRAMGVSASAEMAQLRAGRWQRSGRAIVLHNGPLTVEHRERAALITTGPRSVLTSFSAVARWGLTGWERDDVHVLAPAGTRPPGDKIVLHRAVEWAQADLVMARRLHRAAPALILATTGVAIARHACALLATGVQQRLVTAPALLEALAGWPKLRHYRALELALHDIAQGAQALSEIDFAVLCRRYGIPPPDRQAIRPDPTGQRRYLDAEWLRPDGSILAVEVDGAIHLRPTIWLSDQLRQNEIVLAGRTVLRFPSIALRCEEAMVMSQLRRGLGLAAQ